MLEYKGLKLDKFQIASFEALDNNYNILCCAPTGAGKTLLAEYIIDKVVKSGIGEVIYTAPIKALSNQKFRDFKEEYGEENVGIITGDVVINQNAPIILMTTEIYRNIMYDNPARLSNVKYVVFDEVHYIEDGRRGTVWEESLMLSPENIRFLCLSATIDNADQIGNWLETIRKVKTVVIHHKERPVPLQYGFFVDNMGFFKEKQLFRAVRTAKQMHKTRFGKKNKKQYTVIDYIKKNNHFPVLYFSFSRKRCELNAKKFARQNFLTREEKYKVITFFENFITEHKLDRFSSTNNLMETIENGVAYHHAGLLPPLKQAVEILFSQGLVKILFATETFALGINMPAKSVVFSSLEKNDGISFRYLKNYEFQQMAGRAGRRGIDKIGHVYVNIEPKFCNYEDIKKTVFGKLEPISSQFGFAYSSLLNLYMRHDVDEVKELATLSLSSYQNDGEFSALEEKIENIKFELEHMECRRGKGKVLSKISIYNELNEKFDSLKNEIDSIKSKLRRGNYSSEVEERDKLLEISSQVKSLKKMLSKNPCKKCYDGSRCMYLINHLKSLEKKRNKMKSHLNKMIDLKFLFLEKIGYLTKDNILPRGEFASDIFGFEIQATELYFEGLLSKFEPVEICAILSTITYEKRRDEVSRIRDRSFRKVVYNYIDKIEKIAKIEKKIVKEELTTIPDPGFVDVITMWTSGVEFEELVSRFSQFAEGDLIRQLRQIIDLIRQFKRALKNDVQTKEKLDICIDLINRDVVDAEKYL